MKILSLFDGISCGQLALRKAGIEYETYLASEVDKYAIAVTQYRFPNTIQIGDVQTVNSKEVGQVDLLLGGSPCQGFSFAGKQLNFEDPRSKLFFEYVRILKECKPVWFLLENVKMKQEFQDVISKQLGVKPLMINSDLFVCQNRERLYWTNIPIKKLPRRPKWNNQYYQWRRKYMRDNKSGVCPTLTANMGTGGHNVPLQKILESGEVDRETSFCLDANYYKGGNLKMYYEKSRRQLVFNGEKYRKLTPIECERLQTVLDNYTLVPHPTLKNKMMSDTQRYKMLGNAWTVDVISHIFEGLRG